LYKQRISDTSYVQQANLHTLMSPDLNILEEELPA